jgi:HAE1 family hydrophobic/amphiphilic exporter-1
MFALFLAVVLIYMILASQFESFIHPFTIMLSLPLSIVGVMAGLLIADQTLSIFSMIGIIMLMGLVTKNAILLVDFANQAKREQGLPTREALIQAGRLRLRPILMTAASTIFGMVPIALGLGEGAESRSPMAVAVIGGLMTSTFLTLIVIPVVYSLFDSLVARFKGGSPGTPIPSGPDEETAGGMRDAAEETMLIKNSIHGEANDVSTA